MTETNVRAVRFSSKEKSAFMTRTFGWMAAALFISAVVAFFTAVNMFDETGHLTALGSMLFGKTLGIRSFGFFALCILELVIVWWLSAKIRTLPVAGAAFGFILYSVVNGLTLSSIFAVYTINSIASAFLATAATFLVMCIYGSVTKADLTKLGHYLIMALFGVILASVLQIVLTKITGAPLAMMDVIINIASVIIFTGLTAWDAQKIVKTAEIARDNDDYKKVSILGALELYLDFINLLLTILRIFGKNRD